MQRGIVYLLIFIFLLVTPSLVRLGSYYEIGGGDSNPPPAYDAAELVEVVPTPAASAFVDQPEVGEALVLLDLAHDNQVTLEDMRFLDGRLAARGATVREYTDGDLRTLLRGVTAYIVIAPIQEFSPDEVAAVADFVERGGRLLLIGDPTRYNIVVEEDLFTFNVFIESSEIPLNTLANEFDIIFNGDYLYNVTYNEGNFRNIILAEEGLVENELTEDISQLAFYGSHSLQVGPDGSALLRGDDDTWSSATDRPGGLILGATGGDGRVLALGDINFLTEPYYTVFDNSQFIAQIADFLTGTDGRDFTLTDFPYFFADSVDLVYLGDPDLGPDAFDEIITLQDAFRSAGIDLSLAAAAADSDVIYLGLYNESAEVAALLAAADIALVIDPPILTEDELTALAEEEDEDADEETADAAEDGEAGEAGEEEMPLQRLIQSDLGNVQMSGTTLLLFEEEDGRRQLLLLAASNDGLEVGISRLLDLVPLDAGYVLSDCLLQAQIALCPTDITDEEVEAELLTGGEPTDEEDESDEEEPGDDEDEEEEEVDEDDQESGPAPEIDAVAQGSIGLGESVESELAADERHAWTFSDGPAVIDVALESGDDLDAVLELYDPDNELLYTADAGFTGDDETIFAADIPDDGEYTIVVRDFFDDGGSYSLTILELDDVGENGGDEETETDDFTIFVFEDDDGEPLSSGFTSTSRIVELLEAQFTVQVWTSSVDGPLPVGFDEDIDFLIWDSGDYETEDGFLDEDLNIIFEFFDSGKPIFVTGSAPALFGQADIVPIVDLEINGEDEVLLDGFTAGELIALEEPVPAVFSDLLLEDVGEDSIGFLVRGPESDESGSVVGVATNDTITEQRSIILLLPFVSLPPEVQEPFFANAINWFQLDGG